MRYDKHNRRLERLNAEIADLKAQNDRLVADARSIRDILDSTLHEVRRFSAQLNRFAERLSRDTEEQPQVNQTALSVFYTAGMISSRLAYTDIELNPRALESQTVVRSGIYKKFDKARRILAEEARDRDVTIRLDGESRVEIDTLPVFELLPFVLLENGLKYSPRGQAVTVSFENVGGRQVVTVASIGPVVTDDELPRLFDKEFRGAATRHLPGEGLGLFLAQQVCRFHGIRARAMLGRQNMYQLGGVGYGEFRIVLEF
jgi:signal transduction histidine kinase